MSKFFSALRKYALALVFSFAGLVVLGVGYFDTYPTYWATHVTLSETECYQVATLVAAHEFKRQNPSEAIPAGVEDVLKEATRLAKRVAKYIIEKNQPDGIQAPPSAIYLGLANSCLMSNGEAELK